jgi:hypothetical protein
MDCKLQVEPVLQDAVARIRHTLADKLVGLYLYGSLTLGDFDLDISDIDVLAAVSSDITAEEFAQLEQMHEEFAIVHPVWRGRIEVQYFSLEGLQTFRDKRSQIVVISPGEPLNIKDAGTDWIMNWYLVRETGKGLYGSPADTIIPPISLDEYLEASHEYVADLSRRIERVKDQTGQSYTILTMCRALYLHRNRRQPSKKQAIEWAQGELPEWAWLMQKAWEWRATTPTDLTAHAKTHTQAIALVHKLRSLIRADDGAESES